MTRLPGVWPPEASRLDWSSLPVEVWPSAANFVLFRVDSPSITHTGVFERIGRIPDNRVVDASLQTGSDCSGPVIAQDRRIVTVVRRAYRLCDCAVKPLISYHRSTSHNRDIAVPENRLACRRL